MKLKNQIHASKTHRDGFEPNCPKCLADKGIDGIIRHLESCAKQNEADVKICAGFSRPMGVAGPDAVAKEQRRMIGILGLYCKTEPNNDCD